tara:strand:+ start:964 stop:1068 length:105 start_codon:yes stop_codon:yes gene_type:complete
MQRGGIQKWGRGAQESENLEKKIPNKKMVGFGNG